MFSEDCISALQMSASSELVLGAQFLRFVPEYYHGKSKVAEIKMAIRAWRLSLLVWPGEVTVTEQALPHCIGERDSLRIMVVNLLFEDDSRPGPVGSA